MDQQEHQLAVWAMQELHATPDRVQRLGRLPFKQAAEGLEALKAEVKKRYRQLALKWHPDRNPGNEEEASTRFKMLGRVLEELGALRVQQRPPQPMQQVFHVVFHRNTATTTTATSTVSWANRPGVGSPPRNYDARRVAYIRVV